ncbi:hypothetical protein BGZ65_000183, partial [Modicella reniformis]
MFEPAFRDDGCLQSSIEKRLRDEGLTVWVEKRAVVLGDDALDFDLMSEHGSVQLNRAYNDMERNPDLKLATQLADHRDVQDSVVSRGQKRVAEDGFETSTSAKSVRVSQSEDLNGDSSAPSKAVVNLDARYKVISVIRHSPELTNPAEGSDSSPQELSRTIIDSFDELTTAVLCARVKFYGLLTNMDVSTIDVEDSLDASSKEEEQVRYER